MQEARAVARELDYGNPDHAVNRLRDDLQALQGYPRGQKEFIDLVERNERKGAGVDLKVFKVRTPEGTRLANVRAVQNSPWTETMPGRFNAGPSANVGTYILGQDRHNHNLGQDRHNQASYYSVRNNGISLFDYCRNSYAQNLNLRPGAGPCRAEPGMAYLGRSGMWLAPNAAAALARAQTLAAMDGVRIDISSAGRSHQQQARLYHELAGRAPVAKPGESFHESGMAVDVRNYNQAKRYLMAAGFVHGDGAGPIPGDPWHFRYMG